MKSFNKIYFFIGAICFVSVMALLKIYGEEKSFKDINVSFDCNQLLETSYNDLNSSLEESNPREQKRLIDNSLAAITLFQTKGCNDQLKKEKCIFIKESQEEFYSRGIRAYTPIMKDKPFQAISIIAGTIYQKACKE